MIAIIKRHLSFFVSNLALLKYPLEFLYKIEYLNFFFHKKTTKLKLKTTSRRNFQKVQ